MNLAEQDAGTIDAPHLTAYRVVNAGLLLTLSMFLIMSELIWLHYDWTHHGLSMDSVLHATPQPEKKVPLPQDEEEP